MTAHHTTECFCSSVIECPTSVHTLMGLIASGTQDVFFLDTQCSIQKAMMVCKSLNGLTPD